MKDYRQIIEDGLIQEAKNELETFLKKNGKALDKHAEDVSFFKKDNMIIGQMFEPLNTQQMASKIDDINELIDTSDIAGNYSADMGDARVHRKILNTGVSDYSKSTISDDDLENSIWVIS